MSLYSGELSPRVAREMARDLAAMEEALADEEASPIERVRKHRKRVHYAYYFRNPPRGRWHFVYGTERIALCGAVEPIGGADNVLTSPPPKDDVHGECATCAERAATLGLNATEHTS